MEEDVTMGVAEEETKDEVEDAIKQLKKTKRRNHLTNP